MAHTDAHQPITDAELFELWTDSISVRGGTLDNSRWYRLIKPRCRREHADSVHMKMQNRAKRHADKQKLKKIVLDLEFADSVQFADHRHDAFSMPSR